jgi:hypothetical protein
LPEAAKIFDWKTADRGLEALALYGTITDYTPLLEFANLRRLWVSQANPKQFDLICRLPQLEKLGISWMRSIKSLSPLANLSNLKVLSLDGNLKEVSLEPIGALTQLRVLALAALMSTTINGSVIYCQSFDPLANLSHLEYFELSGMKPREGTLEPFTHLKSLKKLEMDNLFTLEEYARLAVGLPNAEGLFHSPYHFTTGDEYLKCKRCGGLDLVVLMGKKRGAMSCRSCNPNALDEHLAEFEELKQKFH